MSLLGRIAAAPVVEIAKTVGKGIGNILDRFIPKKMTDEEKWEKAKEIMKFEVDLGGQEIADVNKAREMYMTFLRTQKLPWIVRLLNGAYRPVCGYIAILYLTDQFWAQMIHGFFSGFHWTLIKRDPVVDGLVALVIYFFFGYRHKAKQEGLTDIN